MSLQRLGPAERLSVEARGENSGRKGHKRVSLGPAERVLKSQSQQVNEMEASKEDQEKLIRSAKIKKSIRKQILPASERRKTRVQLAQEEALRAFGGNSLGNVMQHATPHRGKVELGKTPTATGNKYISKLERAKMEAVQAFPEDLGCCSVTRPQQGAPQQHDQFAPAPPTTGRKTRKQRAAEEAAALWGEADLGEIEVVPVMSALERAIKEAQENVSENEEEEEEAEKPTPFGLKMVLNYEQAVGEIIEASSSVSPVQLTFSPDKKSDDSPEQEEVTGGGSRESYVWPAADPAAEQFEAEFQMQEVQEEQEKQEEEESEESWEEQEAESPPEVRVERTQEVMVQSTSPVTPAQLSYFGFPEAAPDQEQVNAAIADLMAGISEASSPQVEAEAVEVSSPESPQTESESVELYSPSSVEAADEETSASIGTVEVIPVSPDSPVIAEIQQASAPVEDLSEAAIAKFYETAEASIANYEEDDGEEGHSFTLPSESDEVPRNFSSIKISANVLAGLDPDVISSFGGVAGSAVPNLLSLFEAPSPVAPLKTSMGSPGKAADSWDDFDLIEGVCDISLGDLETESSYEDSHSASSVSPASLLLSPERQESARDDAESSPELLAGAKQRFKMGKTPLLPSGKKVSKTSVFTEMYKLELEEADEQEETDSYSSPSSSSLADGETCQLSRKMNKSYTCKVLKEKLRERGLKVSGVKSDLIERLIEDGYTE